MASLFIYILLGNIHITLHISYWLYWSLCIYPIGFNFLGNPNTCFISQFSPAISHTRFPLCCLSLDSTRQAGFWLLQFQSLPIPGIQISLPLLCRTVHFSKYACNHHSLGKNNQKFLLVCKFSTIGL